MQGRLAWSQGQDEGGRMAADANAIIAGLGGADNIIEIEPCITRLRTEVHDASKVDQAALRAAGAHGVMAAGNVVQVVVGPEADTIASDIEDLIG
ncbi:PTS glucose/sucrose transporter subunit IIB [Nonomuraea sp. NPDC000554]|uniref:PTS glucose/sucrose transporter subunit IIB n=1 Tax=Nonomuraea sp. NPDC000554 TaxID=3154259 RepID=UPI0033273652